MNRTLSLFTCGRAKQARRALLGLSVGLLALAISSCSTVPKVQPPSGPTLVGLMPSNALVYASLKVSRNRRLVGEVLKAGGVSSSVPASVVDKTTSLLAAVRYGSNNKPVVSLVAQGSYPVALMAWRLNWSRNWRKETSPIRWWQDKQTGSQIALPSKKLVLFSNGELPQMLRKYGGTMTDPLNPTVQQAFASADLAIYFPTVSDGLPMLGMDVSRFPVNSFYFAISAEQPPGGGANAAGPKSRSVAPEPMYQGFGVFNMKSERDARLFSVVFKLLIASSENGSAIGGFPIPLSGARLSVNGSTINLTGITVSEKDLSSLLAKVIGGKKQAASK